MCQKPAPAHGFAGSINQFPVRDLRIICHKCIKKFNRLSSQKRTDYLKVKFNALYGQEQFVYALCEPDKEHIRYIGRTKNPTHRSNNHLQLAKNFALQKCPNTQKPKFECNCETHLFWNQKLDTKRWINNLLASGFKPRLKILEKVSPGRNIHERDSLDQSID